MTETTQDIGAELRAARELAGKSLRQIADVTKLSMSSLVALERNQISQLPGGIYRRAIVRAYAREIGLDPEATLRGFLAIHPDDVPTASVVEAPQPARKSGVRALLGLAGALIPVIAAVSYFTFSARNLEAPRRISSMPRPVPTGTPPVSGDGDSAEQISLSELEESPVFLNLSISSRTHLQVIADGREVLSRSVDAGETLRVELSSDVVLVGADASAVHFSINGRAGRTLGAAGVPLNARILRSDYQDWLMQP